MKSFNDAIKMNLSSPVSTMLSKSFTEVSAILSIYKAEKLLKKRKVKYLALIENGEFIGVLSLKEIEKFKHNFLFSNVSEESIKLRIKKHAIKEIARTKLVFVKPETTLCEVCDLYKSILFDSVFVVSNEKLVGFFESSNFVQDKNSSCQRKSLTTY